MSGAVHDTASRQRRASDPAASAWVSADAGTGKTHVLTQRVVRLLLNGAPPAKILCLTFTKAAAANMSERIFKMLAGWAVMEDETLRAAVTAAGEAEPGPEKLTAARRLFAQTVETPGGLKILTLHGFCERLLHLFPFEANVAADFKTIEDLRRAELTATARRAAFADCARGDDAALSDAAESLARSVTSAEARGKLLDGVMARNAELTRAVARHGSVAGYCAALAAHLGLRADETPDGIARQILEGGAMAGQWREVAARLDQGTSRDQDLAADLRDAITASEADEALDAYRRVFFKADGDLRRDKKRKFITDTLYKKDTALSALLNTEQERVAALFEKRRAALCAARTQALLTLAQRVTAHYAAMKAARGLLDYEDLITRTRELLRRSSAAWVLYKLDAGIDHVLVDEAQDTSPAQWDILNAVTADFWSGEGARQGARTFFAVGDDKQSIYSFQGAVAAIFEEQRRALEKRVAAPHRFADEKLHQSFRSVGTVMRSIDSVFSIEPNYRGLSADPDLKGTAHGSARGGLPGHIEIWPVLKKEKGPDPAHWRMPVDALEENAPVLVVAQRIARVIAGLTADGSLERVADADGRPRRITAGDVLILVRSRGPFFEAMIRALKNAGVPVAGADQLELTRHIAVMDLMAAGRAALLPEDDLTLACLLKSPLIGLDDDDLTAIAPGRAGSLWSALRDHACGADRYASAAARIDLWRARARSRTPFEFYAGLLGEDGGRRQFRARLGPEAGDAIDEFLSLALEHQREGAPSLAAFLDALRDADLKIKRDMEQADDAVRVMTVHGAKGLEAKIVFLPDTCATPFRSKPPALFEIADPAFAGAPPFLAWSARRDDDPPAVAAARAAAMAAAADEHRRLLYVALTRAQERLYIAGFAGTKETPDDCWHKMIEASLGRDMESFPAPWPGRDMVKRRAENWPPGGEAPVEPAQADFFTSEDFLFSPAPPERVADPPLRPSHALAAAGQPESDNLPARPFALAPQGLIAGRLMHRLLQHLPDTAPARRLQAASRFLEARGAGLSADNRQRLARAALEVIDDPRLSALFGPGSRAEAAIAGTLARESGAPLAVSGQIDRLAVTGDEVLIADFKTGAPPGGVAAPAPYVAQLALYRAVMATIHPGLPIRAFLIWTSGPEVVEIAPEALDHALAMVRADTAS